MATAPQNPADPPHEIVDLCHNVRFQMARRDGYEVPDVDNWLDEVSAAATAGTDLLPILAKVQFPIARRSGYAAADVDAFIDRLIVLAGGTPPPPPAMPPAGKGFFAKLFGG